MSGAAQRAPLIKRALCIANLLNSSTPSLTAFEGEGSAESAILLEDSVLEAHSESSSISNSTRCKRSSETAPLTKKNVKALGEPSPELRIMNFARSLNTSSPGPSSLSPVKDWGRYSPSPLRGQPLLCDDTLSDGWSQTSDIMDYYDATSVVAVLSIETDEGSQQDDHDELAEVESRQGREHSVPPITVLQCSDDRASSPSTDHTLKQLPVTGKEPPSASESSNSLADTPQERLTIRIPPRLERILSQEACGKRKRSTTSEEEDGSNSKDRSEGSSSKRAKLIQPVARRVTRSSTRAQVVKKNGAAGVVPKVVTSDRVLRSETRRRLESTSSARMVSTRTLRPRPLKRGVA
ncbi:hypothetical protein CC1G_11213 [Coprinopsis cinerea okayama7|uniref:Uncharacterized protein n=1 Tax=Coprinopsis cinerea (strain Okayama-7 / 130 / ATCC MYA-4618 / FGSC 9003) TaxID=240176 RepID=A8NJU8_COPC7|nr:hypothetical protein CC1G_11213 [Coprinopsis cinerea okayama7\|eukprot:XP_001834300.1 hypothetical protein CC1G_11213 [Coprinopsis cinerea okayama7\